MGIEMWFKDDVRNILVSVNASSVATAQFADNPAVVPYLQGYQAAIMAVALACGIPPEQVGVVLDAVAPSDQTSSTSLLLSRVHQSLCLGARDLVPSQARRCWS